MKILITVINLDMWLSSISNNWWFVRRNYDKKNNVWMWTLKIHVLCFLFQYSYFLELKIVLPVFPAFRQYCICTVGVIELLSLGGGMGGGENCQYRRLKNRYRYVPKTCHGTFHLNSLNIDAAFFFILLITFRIYIVVQTEVKR